MTEVRNVWNLTSAPSIPLAGVVLRHREALFAI
jgi:hypothetical protein